MRLTANILACAAGLLLAPVVWAEDEWTLESAKNTFSHHKTEDNSVSILCDGWQISFLAHDGQEIGAVIIMAQDGVDGHEYNLEETLSRVAELVGMDSPEAMEFEVDREMALLLDQTVMNSLAEETEDVFDASPLAAVAYLLKDGYFELHSMRDNGYLHWKTVKKSGVDLLMPMTEKKLQAIEVIGRQEMNEFASEVLAEKLGLGKNTVQAASRQALCSELRCRVVPYMNAKSNELLARTDRRTVIGKRKVVGQMLASRHYAEISYPEQVSTWPADNEEEPAAQVQKEEPPAEEKPLDPPAAREAYIKYLQTL